MNGVMVTFGAHLYYFYSRCFLSNVNMEYLLLYGIMHLGFSVVTMISAAVFHMINKMDVDQFLLLFPSNFTWMTSFFMLFLVRHGPGTLFYVFPAVVVE